MPPSKPMTLILLAILYTFFLYRTAIKRYRSIVAPGVITCQQFVSKNVSSCFLDYKRTRFTIDHYADYLHVQHLAKELPGTFVAGGKQFFRCGFFDNLTLINENNAFGGGTRESHLVRNYNHSHPLTG